MAQQSEVPSLAIAALRLTMAALILFPLAWVRCRGELRRLSRRDLAIAFACGAFLGLHFATWISSLQFTSVASSVMLVTVSPLFVALGSALFLREKLTGLVLTGIAIAIAGGLLISLGDSGNSAGGTAPNPLLGNSLALCGALSIAVYFLIGRRLRLRLSLLAYVSVVYGAAAAVLLAAALVTQTPLTGFDPRAYAWIAALALIPQLIGHTSFNWALGHLPATYATIPALGEPVGATFLAVLLLNESLTPLTVARRNPDAGRDPAHVGQTRRRRARGALSGAGYATAPHPNASSVALAVRRGHGCRVRAAPGRAGRRAASLG